MREKSRVGRLIILRLILGLLVWARKRLAALFHTLWQAVSGDSSGSTTGDEAGSRVVSEPDLRVGGNTVVQGFGRGDEDVIGEQHGDLGGIPREDASSLFEGGSDASDDAGDLSGASAYTYEGTPYDADISAEGVTLSYQDPADREVDVPLDEGIPNLGEPGDVADTGPETAAEEAIVDEVERDVPEEYGEDEPIDSVTNDEPWVADAGVDEDEVPAASRGFREYGEGDADDVGAFGLFEETGTSMAGGEVDLENDEAPAEADEGFAIVDDPDEPLSADAGGEYLLGDEEMASLRDSEMSSLGLTGDYDEATSTQRLISAPGIADTTDDSGADRQTSFATGDRVGEGVDTSGIDRDVSQQQYGETGEFGAPGHERFERPVAAGESSDEEIGPDTNKRLKDDEHLGVSGEFDEAEDTAVIQARPASDVSPGETSEHSSELIGDEEASHAESADQDAAGYSAAWSTPAGVLDEWPNQAEGATGFADDRAGGDEQDGEARTLDPEAPDESATGGSAGESGQITSEAAERAGIETPSSDHDVDVRDASAGAVPNTFTSIAGQSSDMSTYQSSIASEAEQRDIEPITQASVSDVDEGATKQFGQDVASSQAEDRAPRRRCSASAAEKNQTASAASDAGSTPKKSRKQRRMESNWVPEGAVKGDGTSSCPAGHPIKGNANSGIYHRPSDPTYPSTVPEYCFATEEDAKKAGFRAPRS